MVKLFKTLVIYGIYALIVGELIVRIFTLTSDIPSRTIDEDHIQKYQPNQTGIWSDGKHQWQINELGWAGPLPNNYDNLIVILGDSFIENFMNPDECHQAYFLKKLLPENNFIEAARSGMPLIEAMEVSKQIDTLNPKYQLIYLNDRDFDQSISEITRRSDITQLSLENKRLTYGKMNSPFLKKILYNWKFLYYLFNRFPLNFKKNIEPQVNLNPQNIDSTVYQVEQYGKLLDYIKNHYNIDDKILVFKPETESKLLSIAQKKGFKTIVLDNRDEQWSFDYDHHWTCFGHKQAADQVAKAVKIIALEDSLKKGE